MADRGLYKWEALATIAGILAGREGREECKERGEKEFVLDLSKVSPMLVFAPFPATFSLFNRVLGFL